MKKRVINNNLIVNNIYQKSKKIIQYEEQQRISENHSTRFIWWFFGVFISLLPILFSLFKAHVQYADNLSIKEKYLNFFDDFLGSGDLLWLSVNLFVLSLMDAIFLKYESGWKNVTYYHLIAVGISIVFILLGTSVYLDHIIIQITLSSMYKISLVAFVGFFCISTYLKISPILIIWLDKIQCLFNKLLKKKV